MVSGPDGSLWFAAGPRVARLRNAPAVLRGAPPRLELLDVQAPVEALFLDREQSLWVGTQGASLWQLVPHPVIDLNHRLGVPRAPLRGVAPHPDGGWWVADGCRGLAHFTRTSVRGRWFEGRCLGAIAPRRAGGVYVGHRAVERLNVDGGRERLEIPGIAVRPTALLEDARGALWVGTEASGVFRHAGGRATRILRHHSPVSTLVEGPDGAVWVGLRGRVVRISGDATKTLTEEDGVPAGQVRVIVPRPHELWLASYGGGLVRIVDGRPMRFGTREGLPDAFISGLVVDPSDRVWINTNQGLAYAPREAFSGHTQSSLQNRITVLGTEEAMAASPSLLLDGQQSLLAATINGLSVVELGAVDSSSTEAVVRLDALRVDGRALDPDGETRLEPGPGLFEAAFSTALLRAPDQAIFEYRLAGLQEDWIRTPPPGRARYVALSPGAYRFEVRVRNESGHLGPVQTVAFQLEPHFYETALFQTSLALGLLGLMLGGHRLRTRSLAQHNAQLHREVRQRQLAEASMEASERHYRTVFEADMNAIFLLEADGTIRDVNPRACRQLGPPRAELVGARFFELLRPEVKRGSGRTFPASRLPDFVREACQGGAIEEADGSVTLDLEDAPDVFTCHRADDSTFEARISIAPFSPGRSLVTLADVTAVMEGQEEKQRLREQLLHSQRVEAVGRLAGGVAHEVNNLLTAIQGYAELARETLNEGGSRELAVEMIDEVRQGATQTAKVTRQLLDFARQRPDDAPEGHAQLTTLLPARAPMLERLSPDNVRLEFELAEDLPPVAVDETRFEQVLLNLVINAIDAMPEGGRITIAARRVSPRDAQSILLMEDHVRLSVTDTGVGMTDEVLNRVFDPFFTTKDIGEGTGLGLSAVHGIVTQVGGQILASSERGVGSRFDVFFPVCHTPGPRQIATPDVPWSAPKPAYVLYVDDDDTVRNATHRILERRGYDVICASHPMEALEIAAATEDRLHLLITDMVMPDLDGRALARRIRHQHRGMKVLYISGYADRQIEDLQDFEHFLPKPYSANRLYSAVDALLD